MVFKWKKNMSRISTIRFQICKKNKTEHITVFKENYREDHTVSVLVDNNLREFRRVEKMDFIEMGPTDHGLPTN